MLHARLARAHSKVPAGVDSAHPSDALAQFRARLCPCRHVSAARELIEAAR